MIGRAGPLAQPPRHLDAVEVGQHEVDDGGVRRLQRGGVERLPARRRRHDGVARVAQHDPQRPQDLRLVVADEDARGHPCAAAPGAAAACSRAVGSSGISTTNVVPWPGSDSTQTRPPLTSTKPRTMARPRPEPRWPGLVGAGAVERLEDPLHLRRRDRRAAIDDADEHAAAHVARPDRHGVAARVAARVLEQVRERALELRGVGAHQRQVVVEREVEGARRQVEVVDGGADHLLQRAPRAVRLGGLRLEPREVEQVVDEAREARRLRADVGHELVVLRRRSGSASAAPPWR